MQPEIKLPNIKQRRTPPLIATSGPSPREIKRPSLVEDPLTWVVETPWTPDIVVPFKNPALNASKEPPIVVKVYSNKDLSLKARGGGEVSGIVATDSVVDDTIIMIRCGLHIWNFFN